MSVESAAAEPRFTAPLCDYCQRVAVLVGGEAIYPRRPDLAAKRFWRCPGSCDAYVGCHPGTHRPLGRLANLELRQAKMLAHAHFDRRWRTAGARGNQQTNGGRKRAYAWLSRQLNIPLDRTHIGLFDVAMCLRVVDACRADPLPKEAAASQT